MATATELNLRPLPSDSTFRYNKPTEYFTEPLPLVRNITLRDTRIDTLPSNCQKDLDRLTKSFQVVPKKCSEVIPQRAKGVVRAPHEPHYQRPRKWSDAGSVDSDKRRFLDNVPNRNCLTNSEKDFVLRHAKHRLNRHLECIAKQPPSYFKPTTSWASHFAKLNSERDDRPVVSIPPCPNPTMQAPSTQTAVPPTQTVDVPKHVPNTTPPIPEVDPSVLKGKTRENLHLIDAMLNKMQGSQSAYPHPLGMPQWFREKMEKRAASIKHGHGSQDQCAHCGRNLCLTCGVNSRRRMRELREREKGKPHEGKQ